MPTISEDTLASWTGPAFQNEDERRQRTERDIRAAIEDHPTLRDLKINVFGKGSFKNNTNVRRDSDVDVAVELASLYEPEYAQGVDPDETGFVPYSGAYDSSEFKDDVGQGLAKAFGSSASRGNKVFRIRSSKQTLDADVVPCFTHRWYYASRPDGFHRGIRLIPDKGSAFDNYPQQHYDNGVAKNKATSKTFKRVVRILKNLENKMVEDGASPQVPSYLIECLVYNAPDDSFTHTTWAGDVRAVLVHAWEDTEDSECEKRWLEVNGIKYLFHFTQKWTRQDARNFVWEAWQYVKDS